MKGGIAGRWFSLWCTRPQWHLRKPVASLGGRRDVDLIRARLDERPRHPVAVKERCEGRSVGSPHRRKQSADEAAEKELVGAPVDEGAHALADQEASEIVVVVNRAGDPGLALPEGRRRASSASSARAISGDRSRAPLAEVRPPRSEEGLRPDAPEERPPATVSDRASGPAATIGATSAKRHRNRWCLSIM